jgi:uncharacterized LabA/DUF88 family protein
VLRTAFFIDGFNVYHALDCNMAYWKYKWLNYAKLANCYITTKDTIKNIYYFSALAYWNPKKVIRHINLIKALEHFGVETIFGKFKLKDKECRICNEIYQTYEEKLTDVNIAIKLFQDAMHDKYDKAIIISGDSDLLPAMEAVKQTFPNKQIGVIIPIGRRAESLKAAADFYMKMKEKHLINSQFDNPLNINTEIIYRPSHWK